MAVDGSKQEGGIRIALFQTKLRRASSQADTKARLLSATCTHTRPPTKGVYRFILVHIDIFRCLLDANSCCCTLSPLPLYKALIEKAIGFYPG